MAELELPTLAQITDWDVQHLVDAATQWNRTAELWENSFHDVWQGTLRPGGTTWEGSAAENAQDIAWRDLVKIRGSADSLRTAANIAHTGAASLSDVKRLALNASGVTTAFKYAHGKRAPKASRTKRNGQRGPAKNSITQIPAECGYFFAWRKPCPSPCSSCC